MPKYCVTVHAENPWLDINIVDIRDIEAPDEGTAIDIAQLQQRHPGWGYTVVEEHDEPEDE